MASIPHRIYTPIYCFDHPWILHYHAFNHYHIVAEVPDKIGTPFRRTLQESSFISEDFSLIEYADHENFKKYLGHKKNRAFWRSRGSKKNPTPKQLEPFLAVADRRLPVGLREGTGAVYVYSYGNRNVDKFKRMFAEPGPGTLFLTPQMITAESGPSHIDKKRLLNQKSGVASAIKMNFPECSLVNAANTDYIDAHIFTLKYVAAVGGLGLFTGTSQRSADGKYLLFTPYQLITRFFGRKHDDEASRNNYTMEATYHHPDGYIEKRGLFTPEGDQYLRLAHFMNHDAVNPSCVVVTNSDGYIEVVVDPKYEIQVDGETITLEESGKGLPPGTELTFDYGKDYEYGDGWARVPEGKTQRHPDGGEEEEEEEEEECSETEPECSDTEPECSDTEPECSDTEPEPEEESDEESDEDEEKWIKEFGNRYRSGASSKKGTGATASAMDVEERDTIGTDADIVLRDDDKEALLRTGTVMKIGIEERAGQLRIKIDRDGSVIWAKTTDVRAATPVEGRKIRRARRARRKRELTPTQARLAKAAAERIMNAPDDYASDDAMRSALAQAWPNDASIGADDLDTGAQLLLGENFTMQTTGRKAMLDITCTEFGTTNIIQLYCSALSATAKNERFWTPMTRDRDAHLATELFTDDGTRSNSKAKLADDIMNALHNDKIVSMIVHPTNHYYAINFILYSAQGGGRATWIGVHSYQDSGSQYTTLEHNPEASRNALHKYLMRHALPKLTSKLIAPPPVYTTPQNTTTFEQTGVVCCFASLHHMTLHANNDMPNGIAIARKLDLGETEGQERLRWRMAARVAAAFPGARGMEEEEDDEEDDAMEPGDVVQLGASAMDVEAGQRYEEPEGDFPVKLEEWITNDDTLDHVYKLLKDGHILHHIRVSITVGSFNFWKQEAGYVRGDRQRRQFKSARLSNAVDKNMRFEKLVYILSHRNGPFSANLGENIFHGEMDGDEVDDEISQWYRIWRAVEVGRVSFYYTSDHHSPFPHSDWAALVLKKNREILRTYSSQGKKVPWFMYDDDVTRISEYTQFQKDVNQWIRTSKTRKLMWDFRNTKHNKDFIKAAKEQRQRGAGAAAGKTSAMEVSNVVWESLIDEFDSIDASLSGT